METVQRVQELEKSALVKRVEGLISCIRIQSERFVDSSREMGLSPERAVEALSYFDPRNLIIRYMEARQHITAVGLDIVEYDKKMANATKNLPACPIYRGINDLGKENWILGLD